jgi:hypothetical protein
MYKTESTDTLSVETVARDENCLFQRFYPFAAFESLQNNVWLHIKTCEDYKIYTGGKEEYMLVTSK